MDVIDACKSFSIPASTIELILSAVSLHAVSARVFDNSLGPTDCFGLDRAAGCIDFLEGLDLHSRSISVSERAERVTIPCALCVL